MIFARTRQAIYYQKNFVSIFIIGESNQLKNNSKQFITNLTLTVMAKFHTKIFTWLLVAKFILEKVYILDKTNLKWCELLNVNIWNVGSQQRVMEISVHSITKCTMIEQLNFLNHSLNKLEMKHNGKFSYKLYEILVIS